MSPTQLAPICQFPFDSSFDCDSCYSGRGTPVIFTLHNWRILVCYAKYRQSQNISTNYIIRILLHNQNISIKERDITYNLLKLHVVRTIIGPIYKYHCASAYHTHIISEHFSYLNHENENRRSKLTHLFTWEIVRIKSIYLQEKQNW